MRIGFTGTQKGLTEKQQIMLRGLIRIYSEGSNTLTEVHHGDCVGADAEFHEMMGVPGAETNDVSIIVHPPEDDKKRAFCEGGTILEPKPYLERNHDIVDSCDILIACPPSGEEIIRSGTWATVRYARKMGKEVTIIPPDGIPPGHS